MMRSKGLVILRRGMYSLELATDEYVLRSQVIID